MKIVEVTGGSTTSTKQFVWCDNERCDERDNSGTVTRQFFNCGEVISGTSYYFNFDHLDSIREMTNSSGTVFWQQSFDPWGVPTTCVSTTPADFGFGGYYMHSRSSLNLTLARAYSAGLGRFINRDPIGEIGGINLYEYVDNDPIANTDPSGFGCNATYQCCSTMDCCAAMLAICLACHKGSTICCYQQAGLCQQTVSGTGPPEFNGVFPGTNTWARCKTDTDAKRDQKRNRRKDEKANEQSKQSKPKSDKNPGFNPWPTVITGLGLGLYLMGRALLRI